MIRYRVHQLTQAILTAQQHKLHFLHTGYGLIESRTETRLLRDVKGAGVSNNLALVSEIGDVLRFPDSSHLASFLDLTTSKHISGTTLFQSRHITKQGSSCARYAAVNLAGHLKRYVPKYRQMYQRTKARKSRQGHLIALVAIARDFVTNVLYDIDIWRYQRPFFLGVDDYRDYRRNNPRSYD